MRIDVVQGIVHGCPYVTLGKDSLTAALTRLRIQPQAIHAAVTKVQGKHHQLACAATWEGAHGCECVTGINHPNQVRNPHSCMTVFKAKPDEVSAVQLAVLRISLC